VLFRSDWYRGRARLAPQPPPEQAGPVEVGWEVEQRMVLDEVSRQLRDMPAADQQAILSALVGTATASRQETIYWAVRRHRVRARLRRAVDGLAALFPWRVPRWPRLLGELAASPSGHAVTALLFPALVGLLSLPPAEPGNGAALGGPARAAAGASERSPLLAAATGAGGAGSAGAVPPARRAGPSAAGAGGARADHLRVEVPVPSHEQPVRARVYESEEPAPPVLCLHDFPAVGTRCVDRPGLLGAVP
jgi:hypothetical protein